MHALTSRQRDVLNNLDEVTDERPLGAYRVPGGLWLHGFACKNQIDALLKKGFIERNTGRGALFVRRPPTIDSR